jgi:membrane protease YdiL (CAAX protease family)
MRSNPVVQVLLLWLGVNLLIRGVLLSHTLGLHEVVLVGVPVLFMYAPVLSCWWRGDDSGRYPIALPAPSERSVWLEAVRSSGWLIVLTTGPFFLVYHLWHTQVLGHAPDGVWPEQLGMVIGYHLFFVGIPEEFFYRGYVQTRLDRVFGTPWTWFGVPVGPGLLLTCLLFAAGHSIVLFETWHIAIIVPSLAFGWLRAKTGDVMASAFFHAWCNIMVVVLDIYYTGSVS